VTFTETPLPGIYVVEPERREDERGFLARTYCLREFTSHGLTLTVAQSNISYNARRGTVRGLHWQAAPHAEVRLVHCTRGAVYDVLVDLRRNSPAFRQWLGLRLSADDHRMLYVPEGVAHGFQTLEDDTELCYLMSTFYEPAFARGLRWNDPTLAIDWPLRDVTISPRDAALPLLADL
jgi:dTDP-4-dehydrorhamnose 3,5-epimerase